MRFRRCLSDLRERAVKTTTCATVLIVSLLGITDCKVMTPGSSPVPSVLVPSVFLAANSVLDRTFPLGLQIVNVKLPEAFGSDDVAYSLKPSVPGLAFDPATREFSGMPTELGEYAMTYVVSSEAAEAPESITFKIRVVEVGASEQDAPELVHASPLRGVLPIGVNAHTFKLVVDRPGDLLVAVDPFETDVDDFLNNSYVLIAGHGDESHYAHSAGVEDAETGTYSVVVRRFPGGDPGPLRYHVAAWLVPPEEDSTLDIDVRYVGEIEPTAEQHRMMQIAVEHWSNALGDNQNVRSQGVRWSGECNGVDTEFGEFVDDVVVYWRIEDVELAGRGGFCATREGSFLPYVGQIKIDPETGLSRRVFVHEMAHVLGFLDATWERLGLIADPTQESSTPPFPDTHFTGRRAIQEFNAAGGERYAGAKVPLSNDVSIGGLNAILLL